MTVVGLNFSLELYSSLYLINPPNAPGMFTSSAIINKVVVDLKEFRVLCSLKYILLLSFYFFEAGVFVEGFWDFDAAVFLLVVFD